MSYKPVDFQRSPFWDRMRSPFGDFNQSLQMVAVTVQRKAVTKVWPGIRSPHCSGFDTGNVVQQRDWRRRWETRKIEAWHVDIIPPEYNSFTNPLPLDYWKTGSLLISGREYLTGAGNAPACTGLCGGIAFTWLPPSELNFSAAQDGVHAKWNTLHFAADGFGISGTPNIQDDLTVCWGSNLDGQIPGRECIRIELLDEVAEGPHIANINDRLRVKPWAAFTPGVSAEAFDEYRGGFAPQSMDYSAVHPERYTGAPVAWENSGFSRPAIGRNDYGEWPFWQDGIVEVGDPGYMWSSVVTQNGKLYRAHPPVWSYWLWDWGADTMQGQVMRCRFSAPAAAQYWVGSGHVVWVNGKYDVFDLRVVGRGVLTDQGDPVECPQPSGRAFVETQGYLSVGELNFMIIGEAPELWSRRTGYTIVL